MGDNDYTNREIDMIYAEIKEKLELIHKQVIKTNGRVTCLERWRDMTLGGIGVISVLIIPVLIYVVQQWIGRI